jgi:hypothetical protein
MRREKERDNEKQSEALTRAQAWARTECLFYHVCARPHLRSRSMIQRGTRRRRSRLQESHPRGALRRGCSTAQSLGRGRMKCACGERSIMIATSTVREEPPAARGAGRARRGGIALARVCRLSELCTITFDITTLSMREGARGLVGQGAEARMRI